MTLLDMLDQPSVAPVKVSPDSRLARVACLFMQRAGEWIESDELARVGGRCAWRTRVSNCRTLLGMDIRNRQRRVQGASGDTYIVSEYGYKVQGE